MEPPPPLLSLLLLFLLAAAAGSNTAAAAGDGCSKGCDLALGSYYVAQGQNVTYIAQLFGVDNYRALAVYNPGSSNLDYVPAGSRINVSFSCQCLSLPSNPAATYLAGSFPHPVATGET